jgi:nucleoside-diphosphate-sugar epimerase
VINIGSGAETTIENLIKLIGHITRTPIVPLRNTSGGGVNRLWANIGKAHALLSYAPKFSLEDGLRATIERDARFSLSKRDTAPLNEKRLAPEAASS